MNYTSLKNTLAASQNQFLLKQKSVLFYYEDDVFLIFGSNTPESEPQEPTEGWRICKVVPDPNGEGPSIIVCCSPSVNSELF